MASSYTSSLDSHPQNVFSFSTHPFMTNSSSDLLASDEFNPSSSAVHDAMCGISLFLSDRIVERTDSDIPKFKSLPPPLLLIFPPQVSHSSYFAIPQDSALPNSWILLFC
ncbi:hypothetical protein V6N13_054051 [Hibiscus sabdariffa]|uniref:Uncharacterized protein n=1 Tax=Hibiscus sabdariffa TaxID=183260 RepID=A0ABR2T5S1_9ROSI